MKLHLSVAIAGLLIGGLSPGFAQSDPVSPETEQVVKELAKRWETAYSKKDAAGVAALYAENAIEVTPAGFVRGREAAQKRIEADFQAGWHDISISTTDVHALGDALWGIGDWNGYLGDQAVRGHWSNIFVHAGDAWKIQETTFNIALPATGMTAAK